MLAQQSVAGEKEVKQREQRMRKANVGLHKKPGLWLSSKDVATPVSLADLSSSTCQLTFVFSHFVLDLFSPLLFL